MTSITMNPEFLHRAIELSRVKMREGAGGPFGAVVVRQGEIVAEGWNQVLSTFDPTAHAEVTAIRNACTRLRRFWLEDCELYASCEPCPLCLAAIYWARIPNLYFAASAADAAAIGFADVEFLEELRRPWEERRLVSGQGLRDEAVAVLKEWAAKPDRGVY